MSKDSIYRKLAQRFASESPEVLKEAAYNLSLAKADTVTAGFWDKAERAVARIRQTGNEPKTQMLTEAAKKAFASAIAVCPLCKQKMNLVKLLDDREAFYCQEHKVCQPLPPQGE